MPKKPPSKKRPNVQWSKSGFKYSGSTWIKLRNLKRQLNPICQECERNGILTPFHTIDHIKPIQEGGEALDLDNLQTLCEKCHRIKSAKEIHRRNRPGGVSN